MKIACIGGGPAGLYFGILMKQAYPGAEIVVHERNRADDTFGWGVVFSDETLDNFERADPKSFAAIRESFAYWQDIDTHYGGTCVRSTGHGFCGLSRKRLLQIFHERCRELGVVLEFEVEIDSLDRFADADLILACDGINSFVRETHAEHFRPSLDWRKAKFCWLGTTLPLDAFTFIFVENEHGLFQVHAYPFQRGADPLSTFIVECEEETWRRAGLDRASEEETVAYCEALFADYLHGHPLLTNRSIWRTFPTVRNECWHHENIVLVGDAAHTAHFSIGSGTKLAMEDAIALEQAFRAHGGDDPAAHVERVLEAYEDARRVDVAKLQKAAQTSLEWFENARRYAGQHPLQFCFNLMTRSKRITYDNLATRDPELVGRVRDWFAADAGAGPDSEGRTPVPMFTPFRVGRLELANRIVVSPMCQYSAVEGVPGDWHLVHLGSRAVGGAGLVFTEMTNVSAEGRITHGCAGIYTDEQADAWRRIVDFVHASSASKIGMQLGHAGRKGSCNLPWEGDDPLRGGDRWPTLGPSALPFDEGWPAPTWTGSWRSTRGPPSAARGRGSTCSSCTWRTATSCRASSRPRPTGARTRTAARSRAARASRSRCSTPCAPRGRPTGRSPCGSRPPTGSTRAARRSTTPWSSRGSSGSTAATSWTCRARATRRSPGRSTAACTRCRSPSASATRSASRSWPWARSSGRTTPTRSSRPAAPTCARWRARTCSTPT